MNETISEEQAVLSTLSPAMRRALLSATSPQPEVEWDNPADYCTGHESLRGDLMGASDYCEGDQVCHQAREAYERDRIPDPDRLVITVSSDVTVGTVVALIGRGLCYTQQTAHREHELTERGMVAFHALKALPVAEQLPQQSYSRRERERAFNAVRAARHAYRFATEANRTPHAFAEALAAALESVATEGNTSGETLRRIALAMKDI